MDAGDVGSPIPRYRTHPEEPATPVVVIGITSSLLLSLTSSMRNSRDRRHTFRKEFTHSLNRLNSRLVRFILEGG